MNIFFAESFCAVETVIEDDLIDSRDNYTALKIYKLLKIGFYLLLQR